MKISAREVADVAMLSESKVQKDSQRGNLDLDNLGDIVRYIYGNRLLAGGLKVFDDVMSSVSEPMIHDETDSFCLHGTERPSYVAPSKPPLPAVGGFSGVESMWCGTEIQIMENMVRIYGNTREQAEQFVIESRKRCGVERLGEDDLPSIGM